MKCQTQMQLCGSGLFDAHSFGALADALAELDDVGPRMEDTDLTSLSVQLPSGKPPRCETIG